MSLNTKFSVDYADADNYKQHINVVLAGTASVELYEKAIKNLDDGEFIIADQVGLPTPGEMSELWYDEETSHCYSTIDILEYFSKDGITEAETTEKPTIASMTMSELLERISTADWDLEAELERVGGEF